MNNLSSLSKKAPAWTREFDSLVRAIGECKSKAEEDLIIAREVDVLKPRLKDAKLDRKLLKELLVRLIYVEMLGHDASWGHVKALQACSETALVTKKVAYLASTLFLDSSSDLVILVVNTIQRDLKSDNYIVVCTALTALCKLLSLDLVNAVLSSVVELLKHPKELVRKKAVMALHRFEQLDPQHEGPLHSVDVYAHIREAVRDKDVSVMSASLCAVHEVSARDPQPFKNLTSSLISILKQVAEHRLPKGFDYHKTPAPFIQIKLLRLLALLGAGDKAASDNMYAIIGETLRRANTGHTIGNAIIYECVRTITTIYPNPVLLHAAAETIGKFLKSSSHNLRYIGIDALARIVRINAKYAAEHQMAVIDCLEDPDETLKNKTLQLLHKMTKPNNVEVIVGKMMDYLRAVSDDVQKLDAVRRIHELAERFAPDMQWFLDTMNQVFELGGDVVPDEMAYGVMRLIAEGAGQEDPTAILELRTQAVASYLRLLHKPNLPDVLLKVICWVLGEYGSEAREGIAGVMERLAAIPDTQSIGDDVRSCLVSALGKLGAHVGHGRIPDAADELLQCSAASHNIDLQQRAVEALALLSGPAQTRQVALPHDAAVEEVDVDPSLAFLNSHVNAALQHGAAPYLREEERVSMGVVRPSASGAEPDHLHQLRFTAYEAPKPATPQAVSIVQPHEPVAPGLDALPPAFQDAPSLVGLALPQPRGEPQLELKASSARRWGPAQFAPPAAVPTPAAAPAPITTTVLPSLRAAGQAASSPGQTNRSAPPPLEVESEASSGKRQLAASLFGDSSSSNVWQRPGARKPVKAAAKTAEPPPVPSRAAAASDFVGDLLGPESSSGDTQPGRGEAAPTDPFAMLEGLDGPAPAASTAAASAAPAPAHAGQHSTGLLNLDMLYGSAPQVSSQQDPMSLLGSGTGSRSSPIGSFNQQLSSLGQHASPVQTLDLMGGLSLGNGTSALSQSPAQPWSLPQAGVGQRSSSSQPMAPRGAAAVEKPPAKKDPFADLF